MITGKELVEKMYSENYSEYEDTRLYSTGDSELDDLLEKAFCEGYEYAQREFGRTGLTKDQAKEWFKGGLGKVNKAAKRAAEFKQGKQMKENLLGGPKADETRRWMDKC